jgi:hypothetical protein
VLHRDRGDRLDPLAGHISLGMTARYIEADADAQRKTRDADLM